MSWLVCTPSLAVIAYSEFICRPWEDGNPHADEVRRDLPGGLSELGRSWEVSTDLFQKLKEITCHMYLPSTNTTEVKQLRTNCSVPDVEKWTVVSCMSSMPTIKLPFGGNVCRVSPLFQTPRTMVGQQIKIASWSFNGCVGVPHLHQRLSYNCSPASVCVHANYLTALALAMAWSAQTCADYKPATISPVNMMTKSWK